MAGNNYNKIDQFPWPALTPEEEASVAAIVESGRLDYASACIEVLGCDPRNTNPTPGNNTLASKPRKLPGKPLLPPKKSNVRDFLDGGRKNEHRGGGIIPPDGPDEVAAFEKARPDMRELANRIKRRRIIELYVDQEITYNEACAKYRTHFGDDEANKHIPEDLGEESSIYTSGLLQAFDEKYPL
ncbi:hypothetical protein KBD87_03735 [Candidatus Saccharibacteria bacterium]|jgi:hypothetical protein|nr:hypothetical protein [Candidatus Saccharibacteria bacterium]